MLRSRGECSVEEFARALGVSEMTIRRDLQKLAEEGRLVRTHGGAAPAEQVSFEFQFLGRAKIESEAKDRIGLHAAEVIRDGQTVMLDSGTTTLAIARHIKPYRRLTVITTSLPVAAVLQHAVGIETLLLGGYVRKESPDLAGPLTESNLESLRADVAFVGADGIDLEGNVYNGSLVIGRMLQKMVSAAEEVWVVADHTKINRKALISFGSVRKWKGLITDEQADAAAVERLRSGGVNVVVAGERSIGQEKQEEITRG